MSLSVARYFPGNHVYRIALIGEKGAGKTTLLAALGACNAPDSVAGTTCRRLNELPRRPNPARAEIDRVLGRPGNRDPVLAFHGARVRLDEADRDLRAGKQPPVTLRNAPPLLAAYEFGVPGRGNLTVEVAEYSGELLDPAYTGGGNRELVSALFDGCDAILLLADAPRRDDPAAASRSFDVLLGAFSTWAARQGVGARVRKPVAVVFGKWDRRVGPGVPAEERAAELDRLARAQDAHGGLVARVRAVCPTTATFALSAFGQHAVAQPAEGAAGTPSDRPLGYPRSSYGLHAPFVWACMECDRLDREDLADREACLGWLKVWELRRSRLAAGLANRVRSHSAEGTPPHAAASAAYGRARRIAAVQLLLLLLLVGGASAAAWFGGGAYLRHRERDRELARDRNALSWVELALTTADTPDDQFDNALRWLRAYAGSGDDSHVYAKRRMLSPDQATEKVREAVDRRERWAWDRAAGPGQSDPVRKAALDAYLAKYPTGRHADEARKALAGISEREKCADWSAERGRQLDAVRSELAAARPQNSIPEMERVRQRWLGLPPAGPCDTGAYAAGVKQTGDEIVNALVDLQKDRKKAEALRAWYEAEGEVSRALKSGDLAGAAAGLARHKTDVAEVAVLADAARGRFNADAAAAATARKDWAIREGGVAGAVEVEGQLQTAVASTDFAALTDSQTRNALDDLASQLRKWRDRAVYNVFKGNRSEANARKYLDTAPLKYMKGDVEKYLEYLVRLHTPQPLVVEVVVHWKNWPVGDKNFVFVDLYDRATEKWWTAIPVGGLQSVANGTSEALTTSEFHAPPDRPLGIKVRVHRHEKEAANVHRDQGTNHTPRELHSPQTYELVPEGKHEFKPVVQVRVLQVPQPPALEDWKEK